MTYEHGATRHYISSVVIADFTPLQLSDDAPDRVRISAVKGSPRPAMFKVSISYHYGWKAVGTLVYSAPDALEKARTGETIGRQRLNDLNLRFESISPEFFGVNACHPHL